MVALSIYLSGVFMVLFVFFINNRYFRFVTEVNIMTAIIWSVSSWLTIILVILFAFSSLLVYLSVLISKFKYTYRGVELSYTHLNEWFTQEHIDKKGKKKTRRF